MNRFYMRRNGLMVEHHYRETLESIRKTDKRFKGARIEQGWQCLPDQIQVGVIYDIATGEVQK